MNTEQYDLKWTVDAASDSEKMAQLLNATVKSIRHTDMVVRSCAVAGAIHFVKFGNSQYLSELAVELSTKRSMHRSALIIWAEQELPVFWNGAGKNFKKKTKGVMPELTDAFVEHLWQTCLESAKRDDEYDPFKVATSLERNLKSAYTKFSDNGSVEFAGFVSKLSTSLDAFLATQKIAAGKEVDSELFETPPVVAKAKRAQAA